MHFVQNDGLPANRVTWFSGSHDDNWPSNSEGLPASVQTSILSQLSISRGIASDALFALDRGAGRVFVLTRSGTAQWREGGWVRLGQVPGATSPNLAFQATACLESVSKTPEDAAKLRAQISSGVTDNLKSALAGSLVGDLANDVNGLSICTPHGEALGVWLDGEANSDALLQSSIVPTGDAFAVLLPEATLRRAVDKVWTKMPKHQTFEGKGVRAGDQDLELTSYSEDQCVGCLEREASDEGFVSVNFSQVMSRNHLTQDDGEEKQVGWYRYQVLTHLTKRLSYPKGGHP
jgi:hypothetical protein